MAFTDLELMFCRTVVGAYVESRRPPKEIRDKIDIAYRIDGQSIEIFSIRPSYFEPSQKMESPAAKATFVRSREVWKVYWMRQDLKWHAYPSEPEVSNLRRFVDLVEEDAYCCFWG